MKQYTIRRYPWGDNRNYSASADADALHTSMQFKGCVLLDVPKDNLRYFRRNVEYRVIGVPFMQQGREYQLVALPYLDQNQAGKNKLSYTLPGPAAQHETVSFDNYRDFSEPAALNTCRELIKNWTGFFELLSKAADPVAGERPLRRYEQLPEIFERLKDRNEDVYAPLILKISKATQKFLPYVMQGLRKILSREDRLQKLDKVHEVNANSMRWLTRQPGRTIEQKAAANDYQIMAVSRRENFDLLENRVLKDFLQRCVNAARQYMAEQDDDKSSAYLAVRRFQMLCADCLKRPEFLPVQRQKSMPMPNYVLQHDVRYRKIWKYYVELLRQEKKVEELFAWQYFTLSDMANIFAAAALYALPGRGCSSWCLNLIGSSAVTVWEDNRQGTLLNTDYPPGAFHLASRERDYIVEFFLDAGSKGASFDKSHQHAAMTASRLGARSYILLTPLDERSQSVLILLYSLNLNLQGEGTDADAGADPAARAHEVWQSAEQTLRRFAMESMLDEQSYAVYGLIIAPDKSFAVHEGSSASLVTVTSLVRDWHSSYAALRDCLQHIFDKVVTSRG